MDKNSESAKMSRVLTSLNALGESFVLHGDVNALCSTLFYAIMVIRWKEIYNKFFN